MRSLRGVRRGQREVSMISRVGKMRGGNVTRRFVSTSSKDHAKLASDSGTFLAGIGGILCAGIALQQYYMAKSQTECTATLELLKVRCQPEIQGGFDKIVAFKKKMHAKAKLKSPDGRNDYADRFAAALWFSQNSSALAEVFDQDGDHRLTKEEMAIVRLFFFPIHHKYVYQPNYRVSTHMDAPVISLNYLVSISLRIKVMRCLSWNDA